MANPGIELYDDEWSTAEGDDYVSKALGSTYSRSRIYTKATDGHGHSANTQVKTPENIIALLNKYVGLGIIRSVQDGFRDAILHRLHDYNEMHGNGELARLTAEVLATARVESNRARHASRVEALAKFDVGAREIISNGDLVEAAAIIEEHTAMVVDWPPVMRSIAESTIRAVEADFQTAVLRASATS